MALVVSFNGGNELRATVQALHNQVEKIVILDNGSNASTIESIVALQSDFGISVVYFEKNLGIGAALNYGLEIAIAEQYKWVLTMDQDSIADPKMISTMLHTATQYDENAVICPTLLIDGTLNISKKTALDYAITSGNLIPTSLLKKIGKYTEDYFIDSVDFEFSLRLRNAGYKIIQSRTAVLLHNLGQPLSVNIFGYIYHYTLHSPTRRYYIYRNHLYLISDFWTKNPVFLVKKSIMTLFNIIEIIIFDPARIANIKMISIGIFDFFKNKKGSYQ